LVIVAATKNHFSRKGHYIYACLTRFYALILIINAKIVMRHFK